MANVTITGASGRLGTWVLDALLASGKFNVSILSRDASPSNSKLQQKYPSVPIIRVSDDFAVDEVASALKGQDVLVVTVTGYLTELQKRLADAAVKAGVRHFIPADFGSCDSQDERVTRLAPLYVMKTGVREHLQALSLSAASNGREFYWTSLVCGHFFDDRLQHRHVFVKDGRADVFGNGEIRSSSSTCRQIGVATAKILEKGLTGETKNKILYIQSFCPTQNEVIAAAERVSGKKLTVGSLEVQPFIEKWKPLSDAGDADGREELVWVLGTLYANWEENNLLSNKMLGLPEENLDEVLAEMLK